LDALDLITIDLTAHGAKVRGASSAAEALELLRSEQFDLMISDIGMAGENGYDLIRKIRSMDPAAGGRVPAIALTAYTRVEDRLHALRAGYDMHVPKPVELTELCAVAASLTRRKV